MNYLRDHGGTRRTPQGSPIAGAATPQVPNSAGGHAWAVDDWTRLRRFLVLGSEGGSYYAGERDLTLSNVGALRACVASDARRAVDEIVAVSTAGRAPKNDPALYALAFAASHADDAGRRYALDNLALVARTGTHLFQFVEYAESMRGWGRGLRRAVGDWYMRPVGDVAFQAVKYRERRGWSHADLLRLAKPRPPRGSAHDELFSWITRGRTRELDDALDFHGIDDAIYPAAPLASVLAYERARRAATPAETADLIREYGTTERKLPQEVLREGHKADPEVWRALVDAGMPQTALLRNLARLTWLGVLRPGSPEMARVIAQLTDPLRLAQARVHPFAVLTALATYVRGHGQGTKTWQPEPEVSAALDRAFYAAFGSVVPTGKRVLQAVDVSGSMGRPVIAGRSAAPITARVASAALALVASRTEASCQTVAFAADGAWSVPGRTRERLPRAIRPLDVSGRRLDDVVAEVERTPMGGTDCALPMLYAASLGLDVDLFVIYTDSETWAGDVHPSEALRHYRERRGIPARLAVVGMVSNGFSIADPDDEGMLDLVGLDGATPDVLREFAGGFA